ncbi:carboxylesterase family protein [Frankia sp. AgPm24]|uniref:carboxylesterase/lipase family protein n=1 Tax=Frankia sp. AgPm24 TaxID=631128 RepID=UPI0027E38C5B|nr:carboxylesterase family protein [Frankia sp. AgPm24]
MGLSAGCGAGGDGDGSAGSGGSASLPSSTTGLAAGEPAPLTADTSSGRLQGMATGQVRQFLGVRYAQPPTGARRWTTPVPAPKQTGTVEATRAGASCPQAGPAPGAAGAAAPSEDCLFLNITTPATRQHGEKLPVMVWWHGGGFTGGSGSAYDAARLATRGHVMVVTVNYRLGVFGYLSLPGLAGSGTFGLADQVLATRWTKQNAEAFGGDPNSITVFGESAGAMSACALLTSPAGKGLVNRVAMSSGGACRVHWPQGGLLPGTPAQTPFVSLADGERFGLSQAGTLGCADARGAGTGAGASALACLRRASTGDLSKVTSLFSDVLAYGTPLLPLDPAKAIADGHNIDVAVLSSGNRDEQRAFVGGVEKLKPTYTAASYPQDLATAFGANAGRVAAQYPLARFPSAAIAWSTVITDGSWMCPMLAGNADLARHGSTVFSAEFADPHPTDINGVGSPDFDPGAAHATDLPYLFDLGGHNHLGSDAQTTLANAMIDYWASFARTGTPTAVGQPTWPRLTNTTGPTLQLAPTGIHTVDLAAEHHCAFWQSLPR